MTPKKSLSEREVELQHLLATPAGREEIERIELRYQAQSGRSRPGKKSVITYILVHERLEGLVSN